MTIKKITLDDVKYFIEKVKLNLDYELFTIHDLLVGMNVELEHGKRDKFTNVTNDDVIMTGKIALAHLNEFPDYYKRLSKLEKNAEKYWEKRPKYRKYKLVKDKN